MNRNFSPFSSAVLVCFSFLWTEMSNANLNSLIDQTKKTGFEKNSAKVAIEYFQEMRATPNDSLSYFEKMNFKQLTSFISHNFADVRLPTLESWNEKAVFHEYLFISATKSLASFIPKIQCPKEFLKYGFLETGHVCRDGVPWTPAKNGAYIRARYPTSSTYLHSLMIKRPETYEKDKVYTADYQVRFELIKNQGTAYFRGVDTLADRGGHGSPSYSSDLANSLIQSSDFRITIAHTGEIKNGREVGELILPMKPGLDLLIVRQMKPNEDRMMLNLKHYFKKEMNLEWYPLFNINGYKKISCEQFLKTAVVPNL